jgi:uncharacterized protein YjiS (DUF1127 family)
MSIAKGFTPRSTATNHGLSFEALCGRLAAVLRALVAGMAASKDYRHLNGMTERQLRRLGLTRNDIPKELHRRHFEGLDGFSKPAD